jgi:integrase
MLSNLNSNLIIFPTRLKRVSQVIQEFEEYYFTCKERTPKSQLTWRKDYDHVFKRLPQQELLTAELIIEAIKQTNPDSRNRKRFCNSLAALAKFANLNIDLKPYIGKYNCLKVAPRTLPNDSLIEQVYLSINSPKWQWAFGILAAYGLRPHELFHINYERLKNNDKCLEIMDGKTGDRLVFPFQPEWFIKFDLTNVNVPACTGKNNSALGNRVTSTFTRLKLPFRAYDLRHAWAVRSMILGLDLALAAQQMGHSQIIHSKIYHRWISEEVHRSAYESLLKVRQS